MPPCITFTSMKKILFTLSVSAAMMAGCGGGGYDNPRQTLKPGALVDKQEMPVKSLQGGVFRVTVTADSLISQGVYSVNAVYGNDTANGRFTMPKELEHYKLKMVVCDSMPYTYIIGFMLPKDTAFYDYFQITGSHNQIDMHYTKAYSF